MIDVSSRRPPDRLAVARAAHGELESEVVQRSWPPDRFAAARAAHGELESEGVPRSWPPDRLAAARAAHGELESEGVQRTWPPARPTASKTSDGGAAIEGSACWPCGEAFKAPLAVPTGPVQAKGPGCVRPPPDTPGTLLLSG